MAILGARWDCCFRSRRWGTLLCSFVAGLGLSGCGGKCDPASTGNPSSSPDECALNPMACNQPEITPIEDCNQVTPTGSAELDAAYSEVRAMHFYRYGNGHPYCEATSHIMAYQSVVEHGLDLKKLIIRFNRPYSDACGREPMAAWHTVAVLPSANSAGGYLVLDPVYRCRIEPLQVYLDWYVKTDCPSCIGNITGCVTETEDDWLASKPIEPTARCVMIETLPWHYDLFNCGWDLGEPWDQARLARAFSYVRTDLNGPIDYASRSGASWDDYGCNFD